MDLARKIRPKLLLFDLDGTLVDTAPDLTNALNHVLEASGRAAITPDLVKKYVGKGARRLIERGLGELGDGVTEAEMGTMHSAFLIHYGENIARESRAYAGVSRLLDKLAAKNIPAAVITKKTGELANRLLETLGLARYFVAILGGDSEFGTKPDPDPLLHLCRKVGIRPDEALMIGDSELDYEAATRAGMPIALINSGYAEDDLASLNPTYRLERFEQLLDLV